ncbi:MAG: PspC domain-containing protein [Treponema sp.]|nr:PspC domain-containing protein [Treponema sp.]
MKKLKKSNNRVFCGVCGGLSEYLNFDPTIIRLIVCVLSLFSFGTGIILYIIAALIMPSSDTPDPYNDDVDKLKSANVNSSEESSEGKKSRSSGPKKEGAEVPHSDEEFDSYFKNK